MFNSTTTSGKVAVHLGNASQYLREEGKFEVRFKNRTETFKTLVGAYMAYYKADESASIYDVTEGEILVESKTIVG